MLKMGIYKHYKGDDVEVVGAALHSETLEELAVYRHTTGQRARETHFWVRPIKMFLEDVNVNGEKVPRFKYLEK